jgi:hypothetical protein
MESQMKKIIALLSLFCLSSSSFALVAKNSLIIPPKMSDQGNMEMIVNKNNIILSKWIKSNHIIGSKIINEKDVRLLPNFPKEFEHFRIRVIPQNGIATMDYSPERLTVNLDEKKQISSITIG